MTTENMTDLEIEQYIGDLQERLRIAIQRELGTIEINGKKVVLPAPQRCGTETQKRTYANIKAKELIDKL